MLRAKLDRTWDVHWSGLAGPVAATSEVTGATESGDLTSSSQEGKSPENSIEGVAMTSTGESTDAQEFAPATVDLNLEVVTIAVSDVDRAKRFYQTLGWRLDADIAAGDSFRVVQLTPPHSGCSVAFGKGVTTAAPGSAQRLLLVVSDITAARAELVGRGIDVGEIYHLDGGPQPGLDPQGRPYMNQANFSDPDGNGWVLQEVETRLPGRVWDA